MAAEQEEGPGGGNSPGVGQGSRDVQATCPCANSQSRYNDDLRWQKGLYPEDKVEALETEKGC